jgi:hypothetical protein
MRNNNKVGVTAKDGRSKEEQPAVGGGAESSSQGRVQVATMLQALARLPTAESSHQSFLLDGSASCASLCVSAAAS